ncbi:MAG TPA: S8 family serine peptidase, partial [Tepidisphaeraceae bacterium]|nr:S8 family serine peptidase [Tepidisphaeraceae bacterium]
KIVTVSYNIDEFVNDNLYLQAINYMYDNGVLHLNSAGNSSFQNPARLKLDQTLYVSSTDSNDVRSSFSNYGWGIDIAAPGGNIFSTAIGANLTTPSYEFKGGTSMASPNTAAAAALIWAAHPSWTREQVVAQLIGTVDNIDALNPSYIGQLGTGRVNSYKGVTQTLGAPKFRSVLGLPDDGAILSVQPSQIQVRFFNVLDPTAANDMNNWTITGAGYDDTFGTADDLNIPLTFAPNTSSTYRLGTNDFYFNIGQTLTAGTYRFEAHSSGLVDPFGNHLDGNGDGTGGDSFTRTFTIVNTTVGHTVEIDPSESESLDFGTRNTVPPTIVSSIFEFESAQLIRVVFDRDTNMPVSGLVLENLTTGNFITLSEADISYDTETHTATISLDAPIPNGNYSLTLDADQVKDIYGNNLDGNADHTAGDDATITFRFLNGDFNNNGTVGFEDLLLVAQHYGQTTGGTFSIGDATYDGQINFSDLLIVAQSYDVSLAMNESMRSKSATGSRRISTDILK